eukprot:g47717.t1
MINDDACMKGLAAIVTDFLNADVGPALRELTASCRLILIEKRKNAQRPIAPGEIIIKLAKTIALGRAGVKQAIDSHFRCVNFGAGAEGGAATAIHVARQHAASLQGRAWAVIMDQKNAYNEIDSAICLQEMYRIQDLAPLCGITDLLYRNPSKLLLQMPDGKIETVNSENGARQADMLGGHLFCLGFQPLLEEVLEKVRADAKSMQRPQGLASIDQPISDNDTEPDDMGEEKVLL